VSVTENPDGSANIELNLSGTRLLLIRRAEGAEENDARRRYGLEHFGIGTDDIDATVAALKGAGVRFREEIRQARPNLRIAFFRGPDGELVELLERKG
jgi:lactoylglutathione lyase